MNMDEVDSALERDVSRSMEERKRSKKKNQKKKRKVVKMTGRQCGCRGATAVDEKDDDEEFVAGKDDRKKRARVKMSA